MSIPSLAILLLLACRFCGGGLPDGNDNDNSSQTNGGDDDSSWVDTAPPAACDQPETEPNSGYTDANPIEMEFWACGEMNATNDTDFLSFDTPYDGWIKLRVHASSIGSSADMQLLFGNNSSQYTSLSLSQRTSTDPFIVAPVPGNETWYAILSEQYGGSGEDYFWEFHASMTKEPTDWDVEEEEDNDSVDEASLLESGTRVFGTLESGSDQDWYLIDVPEEGMEIALAIEAHEHGSPLFAELSLYKPDGTRVRLSSSGGTAYDQDPIIDYTSTAAGTWGVLVQVDGGSSAIGASNLSWYVLDAWVGDDPDTGL